VMRLDPSLRTSVYGNGLWRTISSFVSELPSER